MADKTPLEKLEEFLSGTGLVATPESLTVALALVNGVDAEQMRLDLALATDPPGEKDVPADDDEIVVNAKTKMVGLVEVVVKPAQTVGDIITAAAASYAAEAVLIDAYIRAVLAGADPDDGSDS